MEAWQDDNNLILVNDPNEPPTFFHRGWRTCSTPDLAFCSEDVHKGIKREVGSQLGGSDHRPVFLTIERTVIPIDCPRPRWNYKKAKWSLFLIRANELIKDIRVQGRNENSAVKEWTQGILKAAKETIPRGHGETTSLFGQMICKYLKIISMKQEKRLKRTHQRPALFNSSRQKQGTSRRNWKQRGNHGEKRQAR